MAWMKQQDAVYALGVSQRTLSRWVASGKVETKRDGSNVLVWAEAESVESPVRNVMDIGETLAKAAVAFAAAHKVDGEALSANVQTMADIVRSAQRAEKRAFVWQMVGIAVFAALLMAGSVFFVMSETDHIRTVSGLESEKARLIASADLERANTLKARASAAGATQRAHTLAKEVQRLQRRNARLVQVDRWLGYLQSVRSVLLPWGKSGDLLAESGAP